MWQKSGLKKSVSDRPCDGTPERQIEHQKKHCVHPQSESHVTGQPGFHAECDYV